MLSHPLIPIAGPIAMCHGSERYPVVYTVITGKYLRSNINNSCLECSLIPSIADGGRIMYGGARGKYCHQASVPRFFKILRQRPNKFPLPSNSLDFL